MICARAGKTPSRASSFSEGTVLRSNAPQPGTPMNVEVMKAAGFRNMGILVVHLDDSRLNDWERQFLKNIGRKVYGSPAS